ncbi:MAG: hypothetical protein R2991_15595 [Thermoanaerobaculia bacterium]
MSELERDLETARALLREHHAGVTPDPSFAARVVAHLPAAPDPLGWAARRLLPAALTLALLLGVMVWRELPGGGEPASVDDLAAWMVDPSVGEAP